MLLSDFDVRKAFGLEPDAPDTGEPSTPAAAALGSLAAVDAAFDNMVRKVRQPGESHSQAAARLLRESPSIYENHGEARHAILRRHGIENLPQGRFVQR
jgi:hypothetical protein